jgi:hypothetical protein
MESAHVCGGEEDTLAQFRRRVDRLRLERAYGGGPRQPRDVGTAARARSEVLLEAAAVVRTERVGQVQRNRLVRIVQPHVVARKRFLSPSRPSAT